MIYAVIFLSITVLVLIALVLYLVMGLIGAREHAETLNNMMQNKAYTVDLAQSLIKQKFDYYLPMSERLIELEIWKVQNDKRA
jgi:amino acid permease